MKRIINENSFETEITVKVKVSYIPDKGYAQTWEEPGEPPSAEITSIEIIQGKELIPINPDFVDDDDLENEALEDAAQDAQDRYIDHAEMIAEERKYGF